jgi:hypothetical protein
MTGKTITELGELEEAFNIGFARLLLNNEHAT